MSDTGSTNGGWLPPAQVPPESEPATKPPAKKAASGWLIPAAIVAAGLLIAMAVLMSRSSEDVAGSSPIPLIEEPAPSSEAPPPVIPTSPVDTTGDALAQDNLQAVAAAAQGIYGSSGSYLGATSFDMAAQFPDLTFVDPITESTTADEISISTATTTFSAAAKSDGGTCWWVRGVADQVSYGTGAACTGTAAGGAQSAEWPSPSPGVPVSPSSGTPSPSQSPG